MHWSNIRRALGLNKGNENRNDVTTYDEPNGITSCIRVPDTLPDTIYEFISVPSNLIILFPNIIHCSEKEVTEQSSNEIIQQIRRKSMDAVEHSGNIKAHELQVEFRSPNIVSWWKPIENKTLFFRVDGMQKIIKIFAVSDHGEIVTTDIQIGKKCGDILGDVVCVWLVGECLSV